MAEENEIIGSASEFIKGEFESQLLSFGCCLEFDDGTSLDRAVKCQMAISKLSRFDYFMVKTIKLN
jgi:hypothetical protein